MGWTGIWEGTNFKTSVVAKSILLLSFFFIVDQCACRSPSLVR